MVSRAHEAPLAALARMPELLVPLLENMGIETPPGSMVEPGSERCTRMKPTELRADGVMHLKSPSGDLTAVIEVQLKRKDEKLRSWPSYVADVWQRTGQPVVLLVICPDSLADWARTPIVMGAAGVVTPSVLSTSSLPVITDPRQFDGRVEIAVFAAMMHAESAQSRQILDALNIILSTIETDLASRYAGLLIEVLPPEAVKIMEEIVSTATFEYQDALARMEARGEARGEVRGEAKMLLGVFDVRGIDLTDDERSRVGECRDEAQLRTWLERAITATTAAEVFTD